MSGTPSLAATKSCGRRRTRLRVAGIFPGAKREKPRGNRGLLHHMVSVLRSGDFLVNVDLLLTSISPRRLVGRRVQINIKSRDLAVACDDEIDTGVRGRFALRPRAPRQTSRIVQNLRRAMWRIDIMRMCRSKVAGKPVQCGEFEVPISVATSSL